MTRFLSIAIVATICLSFATKADEPDPNQIPAVANALAKADAAIRENRKAYEKANDKIFADLKKKLDDEKKRLTKAGELQKAVVVQKLANNIGAFNPHQNGAVVFNGRKYKFVHDGLTWGKAEAQCRAMGGNLVVIDNDHEQDFICEQLKANDRQSMWLGITHAGQPKGEWVTVHGKALAFANWTDGEPENDDCGVMAVKFGGKWHDGSKDKTLPFICEWDE